VVDDCKAKRAQQTGKVADLGERVNDSDDERRQRREVIEAGSLRTRHRASSIKILMRRRCRCEDQRFTAAEFPGPGVVASIRTPHRWRLWVPEPSALLVGVSDLPEKKPLHVAFACIVVIVLGCEDKEGIWSF
jgi:hypothetical protein